MVCYLGCVISVKKNCTLIGLLAALTASAGSFEDKPWCSNLARVTSQPGEYTDGTGIARNAGSTFEFIARIHAQFNQALVKRFKEHLQSSAKEYIDFRDTALNALSFDCDPSCPKPLQSWEWNPELLHQVASSLAGLAFDTLLPEDPTKDVRRGAPSPQIHYADKDFIVGNSIFAAETERLRRQILEEYKLEESLGLVQRIWGRVRPIMIALAARNVEPSQRSLFVSKIEGLRLLAAADACRHHAANGPEYPVERQRRERQIRNDLMINAFYNPISRAIEYCPGLIALNQSEFGIAFILAHEAAHAIDPCYVAIGPGSLRLKYQNLVDPVAAAIEYPIPGLIECLRTDQSVKAQRTSYATPPSVPGKTAIPPLPPASYSIFCSRDGATQVDQIPEAVADWFGTEALVEYIDAYHPNLSRNQYIYGYANAFRGIYESGHASPAIDEHPDMDARINHILLQHPKVRTDLECTDVPSPYAYCPVSLD